MNTPQRLRMTLYSGLLPVVLAGCGPPPEADFPASLPPEQLPLPQLAPTARFDGVLAQSGPDRDRLENETDALAARAAALRERAAELDAPLIDDATLERLQQGLTSVATPPPET